MAGGREAGRPSKWGMPTVVKRVPEPMVEAVERFVDAHAGAFASGGEQGAPVFLAVSTFELGTEKEGALKPLEEAAEVYGAWQEFEALGGEIHCFWTPKQDEEYISRLSFRLTRLADEIADCVQACANLAARYGIDLDAAMRRCHERNRERGRCD